MKNKEWPHRLFVAACLLAAALLVLAAELMKR